MPLRSEEAPQHGCMKVWDPPHGCVHYTGVLPRTRYSRFLHIKRLPALQSYQRHLVQALSSQALHKQIKKYAYSIYFRYASFSCLPAHQLHTLLLSLPFSPAPCGTGGMFHRTIHCHITRSATALNHALHIYPPLCVDAASTPGLCISARHASVPLPASPTCTGGMAHHPLHRRSLCRPPCTHQKTGSTPWGGHATSWHLPLCTLLPATHTCPCTQGLCTALDTE